MNRWFWYLSINRILVEELQILVGAFRILVEVLQILVEVFRILVEVFQILEAQNPVFEGVVVELVDPAVAWEGLDVALEVFVEEAFLFVGASFEAEA